MKVLPARAVRLLLVLNLVFCIALIILGSELSGSAQDDTGKQLETGKSVSDTAGTSKTAQAPKGLKARLKEIKGSEEETSFLDRFLSIFGLLAMLGLAFAFSKSRKSIDWKLVGWGVGLQFIFALLILKTYPGQWVFQQLSDVVNILLSFTEDGARFVFGNLVKNNVPVGQPLGDSMMGPVLDPSSYANTGAFFAFNVLPTIIFFSSLMTVMYHLGIMQLLVRAAAWIMQKTMGTSGAETLSAAGNIFVGQTEAPLMIRPYVDKMTTSELMAVMTGGFATIAGGVLAAYVGMLRHVFPDIAGHLIAASVMSAPAALVIAKIMNPETEESLTKGKVKIDVERPDANIIDAAARGASDGLRLALNVGAMILAFIALIAMINFIIMGLGNLVGLEGLTFQKLVGYIFWPLAWVIGIPTEDCLAAGQLLGEKTILNEFVAFLHLEQIISGGHQLSYRTVVILTYALAGFSNLGSIAIQLGGIGGIAPNRRKDLARLGLRAMIAGTLACLMTATLAGMLI